MTSAESARFVALVAKLRAAQRAPYCARIFFAPYHKDVVTGLERDVDRALARLLVEPEPRDLPSSPEAS